MLVQKLGLLFLFVVLEDVVCSPIFGSSKRGKRDVYCDKQVEEVVTVLNCMLKGSWKEGESGGIRKKLKCKAQLICNIKIDEMIVGSI